MLNLSRVHHADRTDLELAFIELQDDAIVVVSLRVDSRPPLRQKSRADLSDTTNEGTMTPGRTMALGLLDV
jgi:hypothetical protein